MLIDLPLAVLFMFRCELSRVSTLILRFNEFQATVTAVSKALSHVLLSLESEVPVGPRFYISSALTALVWRVTSWPLETNAATLFSRLAAAPVVNGLSRDLGIERKSREEAAGAQFRRMMSSFRCSDNRLEANTCEFHQRALMLLTRAQANVAFDVSNLCSNWERALSFAHESWSPSTFTVRLPPAGQCGSQCDQSRDHISLCSLCGSWVIPDNVSRSVDGQVLWGLLNREGPRRKRIRVIPHVGPSEVSQLVPAALEQAGVTDPSVL